MLTLFFQEKEREKKENTKKPNALSSIASGAALAKKMASRILYNLGFLLSKNQITKSI